MSKVFLVLATLCELVAFGHKVVDFEDAAIFAAKQGLLVSFEHPVYSNGYFLGFEAWNNLNRRYGASNVTFIVRVEFDRAANFRENRIRRHFKRFFLPGAMFVERNIRSDLIHYSNLTEAKVRNESHVDIWLTKPKCFIRHNGVARIHRVAKSLKSSVVQLRWLAKITFDDAESYDPREVMEIAKAMAKITGVQCAWLHPPVQSTFSMMIRFFPGEVPQKSFFSPTKGYTNWNSLNNEYQVAAIHYVRGGYNRALVDFAGGIACSESQLHIARRYRALPAVRFVYLDGLRDCRFTYQIIIAFDRKIMNPDSVRTYNQWSTLNRLYGVVGVSYAHANDLRAVLEFEPGLYSHHQMRAIRDEYLKLPGTKFGWVSGRRAKEVTTIVLHFSRQYLKRVPMRKYRLWDALNRKYSTNITILEESRHRAFVRFPEGKYSDLELKSILRKYRKLPGINGVRMDKLDLAGEASKATNATLGLPPQRGLRSWMRLSNARKNNIVFDGDENHVDWHRVRHSGNRWDTSPCINDA